MITVEDINSVMTKYCVYTDFHEIDTSKISTNEYVEVKYDFCICAHTISDNNHTFSFEVVNSAWNGFYYFKKLNGDYIDSDASYDSETGVVSFTTTEESVILVLYCLNIDSFHFVRLQNIPISDNVFIVDYTDVEETAAITYKNLKTNAVSDVYMTLSKGFHSVLKAFVFVCKVDFELILNETDLITGKINRITFNAPSGDIDAICTATYLDKTETFNLSDGEFEVDLTSVTDKTALDLKIKIHESDMVLSKTINQKLNAGPVKVDNYSDFINQILTGARIIEVISDIELLDNVNINHNLKVIGNDFDLDMGRYSFIVAPTCTFKLNNINVTGGNPVILQMHDSKVDLVNVDVTGATNTRYNNLGSIISCDIDISSLEISDDFTTNITNCTFSNNHNCILHGGILTVNNTRYHNTDMNMVDINNPAFLYQVDGEANITNSIFDIDYAESTTFESNNIMYGQALFMIGENALINNATHKDLAHDGSVNWCNAPFNNLSHLYCKYYYPQISEIVYSSPVLDKEDKCLCYAVSGSDWVFKDNVQITRASLNQQNTNKKITW